MGEISETNYYVNKQNIDEVYLWISEQWKEILVKTHQTHTYDDTSFDKLTNFLKRQLQKQNIVTIKTQNVYHRRGRYTSSAFYNVECTLVDINDATDTDNSMCWNIDCSNVWQFDI